MRTRRIFERLVPNARFEVIPNGVDVDAFVPSAGGAKDGIVFVGGMSWFPNADALEFFDEEILPLVRARDERVKVTWVGRAKPDVIASYAKRGIAAHRPCRRHSSLRRICRLLRRAAPHWRRHAPQDSGCVGDGKGGGLDVGRDARDSTPWTGRTFSFAMTLRHLRRR